MNEILERTLLYDFYGELLNTHQKEIYEKFLVEDLSLSEIAGEAGISRQGVHDMIRRCDAALRGYEERLHLVERFLSIREKVQEINRRLEQRGDESMDQLAEDIRRISDEIIEEL